MKSKVDKAEEKKEHFSKALLSSIFFGDKSLILRKSNGGFYQCIKGKNKIYFIYVGSELSSVNMDSIITDFSDEDKLISKKKDFVINKAEMSSITYKEKKDPNLAFDNSGYIIIKCNDLKKQFQVIDTVSASSIKIFFQGIKANVKSKSIKEKLLDSIFIIDRTEGKDIELETLRPISAVLTYLSLAAGVAFFFLESKWKFLSILCILLFSTIFILYTRHNNVLSLADKKNEKRSIKEKINVGPPLLMIGMALAIRSDMDFNLTSYKVLVGLSLLLFSTIMFVFFYFTKEYKRNKSSIWIIIISALLFSPGAVIQTNYIFDFSKPTVMESRILHMKTLKKSNMPYQWLIDITDLNGNKIEVKVPKESYRKFYTGRPVNVVEKEGCLKVPYVYVENK